MTTPSPIKKGIIGVLGGRGMLGADLVKYLGEWYETVAIDKDDYEKYRGCSYDMLVNANGNSRRFWANQNPRDDFYASTVSVYESLGDFRYGAYVYISSSDVYPDHTTPSAAREDVSIDPTRLSPYGFHKYLAERVVEQKCARQKNYLILRSSMILGTSLKKGPFYDILRGGPLFVALESQLQLITTRAIAEIVRVLLEQGVRGEIFNVGGKGTFPLQDTKRYFAESVAVAPGAETQVYEMNVGKVSKYYPLKTSEEYLREFLSHGKKEDSKQEKI